METTKTRPTGKPIRQAPPIDFHGAAIVGANGEEVPITESMIQRALAQLIRDWEVAYGPEIPSTKK